MISEIKDNSEIFARKRTTMKIHGLNKLTLLDYPEHTACTLFCGQCNFRCPFCQNFSLVSSPENEPVIPDNELFSFLEKRKHLLQGVCITGGEPTVHKDLDIFIKRIKELGFKVKLDTNGTDPDMLQKLIEKELIDMAAMDIKSSQNNYAAAAGLPYVDIDRICASVSILKKGRIPYEFRTTLVKGLHTEDDIYDIGIWLHGASRYYLQHFEKSSAVPDASLEEFSLEEMQHFRDILLPDIPSAAIRGI